MKKLSLVLLAGFLLFSVQGCKKYVRARVIKVERADQEITGNQGYLCGKNKKEPKTRETKYRKIFEIDVSRITDKKERKLLNEQE